MSDFFPKSTDDDLKSKILNVLKGKSVRESKDALTDCLYQVEEVSKVV
ncbi:hypothetical protein [Winogradskyella sediminis]|nr:hypothetical protein [Winogradskyella sediminis]REG86292.1 hypothetical protein C8N41_103390 [Winogradskyella sediminis]